MGPKGDIAVVASFAVCGAASQRRRNRHITVPDWRHVAFTRNYLAAGFAQGSTLLWIGRSNLRLSEWICAVHCPVSIQSIDLGVR